MSEINDKITGAPRSLDGLVVCKWWKSHQWLKWEDIYEAKTIQHRPVLIQERRCKICNAAQRRDVAV
jgi:hypothetical protein